MTSTSKTRRSVPVVAAVMTAAIAAGTLLTSAPAAAASSTVFTVDSGATNETRSLDSYLHGTAASGRVLFGHQNDLTESVSDNPNGDVFNDVGAYPAVMGLSTTNAADMTAATKKAYSHGIITTVDDHMSNFTSGGGYGDLTPTVPYILPGGKDNAAFRAHLDMLAQYAKDSTAPDGSAIPIILRPFHENNGSWFWWGATNTTKAEFVDLWRYTVEYLRDVKGVHNFLYAYSPNGHFASTDDYLQRWPGDDYVDIVGFDTYYDNPKSPTDGWFASAVQDAQIATSVAVSKGKIAAATEMGLRWNGADGLALTGNAVPDWYTRVADMLANASGVNLAYLMTWRNQSFNNQLSRHFFVPFKAFTAADGTSYPDHEMLSDFQAFYHRPNIAFADSVSGQYSLDTTAAPHPQSGYLMSPRTSNAVTYSGVVPLQAKAFGDVSKVTFTAGGATIPGAYNATSGYWEASWDSTTTPDGPAVVRATIQFADGTDVVDANTVTVKNGGAVADPGLIDDFESYADDADLAATWQRNVNGGPATVSLVPGLSGNGHAMKLTYDAGSPGYVGVQRPTAALDWVAFGKPLHVSVQSDGTTTGEVSLQVTASTGVYAVYLKDVPGFSATSTAVQELTIPANLFNGVSWSNPATPTLSGEVQALGIYSSGAGSFTFDDFRLGDVPVVEVDDIDSFESYADSSALGDLWQRNVNGGPNTLALVGGLTSDSSSHAMQITYDSGDPGYTGISRPLQASDWLADGKPVRLLLQVAPGSTGNILLQVSGTAGTYQVYLKDVPGFDPSSSDVQDLVVPLDLFKGVSWSNPATPTLSGAIQTFDIYFESGKGTVTVDNIRRGTDVPLTKVTPQPPAFTDDSVNGGGTLHVPSQAGVDYAVNGNVVTAGDHQEAGGTITVTASAQKGYVFTSGSVTEWNHAFPLNPGTGSTSVTPAAPTFTDDPVRGGGVIYIPTTVGVSYSIDGKKAAGGNHGHSGGDAIVEAIADSGYVIAGAATTKWTHQFPKAVVAAPTVQLDLTHVAAGGKLTINADGFAAGEEVTVWLHSDPVLLATVHADTNGHVTATVTIPSDTAPGKHQIELRGSSSGTTAWSAVFSVDPVSAPAGDTLASTGSEIGTSAIFAAIAILMMLGGGIIIRRRRNTSSR